MNLPLPSCDLDDVTRPNLVLLADDDLLTRRALGATLRAAGCRVVEAHDGEEALARARARAFDLVLLDVNMPRRSGIAVAQELRADGSKSRIVLMSAAALAPMAGFPPPLRKPVTSHDLRTALGLVAQPSMYRPDAGEARSEIERALAEIGEHLAVTNAEAVAASAHRLAGLASLVALDELATAALALEEAALSKADLEGHWAAVRQAAAP